MKKVLFFCLISFFCGNIWAQAVSIGMTMMDSFDDNSIPLRSGIQYNDCWGYVDANGREYAILGSTTKIHFFDITDPSSIVEVVNFTNLNIDGSLSKSLWRDFKTFGNYAYAVADENNEGLIVFDLSNLPTSVTKVHQSNNEFNKAHNLYIDVAKSKLYIAGSNTVSTGLIQYDLSTTPESPVHIRSPVMSGGYSHDVHVRNDTVYAFHGNSPSAMFVYDFSNPTSVSTLGTITSYSNSGYNHSGWLTDDGDYIIFCDETTGRQVKVADIRDLTDISAPSSWYFESNLSGSNPLNNLAHNPFIKGDTLFVSYYADGVQVFDISDITNITRIAYYDTEPSTSAPVSDGCWGVYPYFPSNTIIASDVLHGLIVIKFDADILPLKWGEFIAFANEKKQVSLQWSTLEEVNTEKFIIERGDNSQTFEVIGQIRAAVNSQSEIEYQFEDENPNSTDNYYRLKQIDKDGSFSYSGLRYVPLQNRDLGISLSPNFSKPGSIDIRILHYGPALSNIKMILHNSIGQSIHNKSISLLKHNHTITLDLQTSGTYYLTFTNQNGSQTLPFIVQ